MKFVDDDDDDDLAKLNSTVTTGAFSCSSNVLLVEQTPPTLPYMDAHYASGSTTTGIHQPECQCGWASR